MYVHVTGANIGLSSDLYLGINRKDSDTSHECHTNADCDVLVGAITQWRPVCDTKPRIAKPHNRLKEILHVI